MKIILKIAKAELQLLFYSPIAWLILILFSFTTGSDLAGLLREQIQSLAMGYPLNNLTSRFFSGWDGILTTVQGNLYLFLPLLTMNLMSRELSSGSIKLLYTSPITDTQIILGKYLSMVGYILVLMAILSVYCVWGAASIEHFNYEMILSGLLGLFLLTCAYAAIGLFMSGLTSYQVVAAIGTLAIFTVLSMISGWGQNIAFVRDITYWLSMTGRSMEFVQGMISTENVLYFLLIIALFLSLSILRLQSRRTIRPAWVTALRYVGVCLVAVAIGYFSSRPAFKKYMDVTATQINTITPPSQDIVSRLDGEVKITSYVNLLDEHFWIGMPERLNEDKKLFERYLRFKPDIKLDYVYYYHDTANPSFDERFPNLTPEEKFKKMIEINNYDPDLFLSPEEFEKLGVDLSGEGYRFVRQIEYKGKKTFLRIFDDNQIFPSEAEISAALKRLVMDLPTVGFVMDNGARPTDNIGERAYSMFARWNTFRQSLINQGFAYKDVSLNQSIPQDVNILVVADLREPLNEAKVARLREYIDCGGNLLVTADPGDGEAMNSVSNLVGVHFGDGQIVHPTAEYPANLVLVTPTEEAGNLSYFLGTLRVNEYGITMPGAMPLTFDSGVGFEAVSLFRTPETGYWNELETVDFVKDTTVLNPTAGEKEASYDLVLALSRTMGDKTQKILISGDADCISNGELTRQRPGLSAFNYYMVLGAFDWLSDGEAPVDVRRPDSPDNDMVISESSVSVVSFLFVWLMPGLMLLAAIFIWLRRRGR